MCGRVNVSVQKGFTLVELVCVLVLASVVSITLASRFNSVTTSASIQTSRDDLIAALFFAQQTAMARDNISLVVTAGAVSVKESGTPIVLNNKFYPLSFPTGVTATPATFTYDKLGRTTAGSVTLSKSGTSVTVTVEATGYAH